MKKSLIAAATLAAVALGAANVANAGVAGTGLGGISAHADTQLAEHVDWRHHHKHWVCHWRHGHKHCWWN